MSTNGNCVGVGVGVGVGVEVMWSYTCYLSHNMSILSKVKFLFAANSSDFGKVMSSKYVGYDGNAHEMMYDFHVFNAEIYDLPSDTSIQNVLWRVNLSILKRKINHQSN